MENTSKSLRFIYKNVVADVVVDHQKKRYEPSMFSSGFEPDESYQYRYKRAPNTRPKFVQLHPRDNGDNLDNVFYGGELL